MGKLFLPGSSAAFSFCIFHLPRIVDARMQGLQPYGVTWDVQVRVVALTTRNQHTTGTLQVHYRPPQAHTCSENQERPFRIFDRLRQTTMATSWT